MKNYSSGSGVGITQTTLDESEIYFSTYMSPPPSRHRHHHHHHHSTPKHVNYAMMEEDPPTPVVAKPWDVVEDIDDEASDFILKRHRKLELAKLMSMAPYN